MQLLSLRMHPFLLGYVGQTDKAGRETDMQTHMNGQTTDIQTNRQIARQQDREQKR